MNNSILKLVTGLPQLFLLLTLQNGHAAFFSPPPIFFLLYPLHLPIYSYTLPSLSTIHIFLLFHNSFSRSISLFLQSPYFSPLSLLSSISSHLLTFFFPPSLLLFLLFSFSLFFIFLFFLLSSFNLLPIHPPLVLLVILL